MQETVTGALKRLRAQTSLAATGLDGTVTDPELLARVEDFIGEFLPEGQPSALSDGPDRLAAQARAVRTGLTALHATAPLVVAVDAAVQTLEGAVARVSQEADELVVAYAGLSTARDAADTARRCARAWTEFSSLHWPDAGIDPERIFPTVSSSTRATEADLDAAGVDPLDADA